MAEITNRDAKLYISFLASKAEVLSKTKGFGLTTREKLDLGEKILPQINFSGLDGPIRPRELFAFLLKNVHLFDPQTGLMRREIFLEESAKLVSVTLSKSGLASFARIALLFLDLRGLKAANDCGGYHVGDALLCSVASILKEKARELVDRYGGSSLVSRFGGDEFCIFFQTEEANLREMVTGKFSDNLISDIVHETVSEFRSKPFHHSDMDNKRLEEFLNRGSASDSYFRLPDDFFFGHFFAVGLTVLSEYLEVPSPQTIKKIVFPSDDGVGSLLKIILGGALHAAQIDYHDFKAMQNAALRDSDNPIDLAWQLIVTRNEESARLQQQIWDLNRQLAILKGQ